MYNLNSSASFAITSSADTYIYDMIPVAAGIASISSDNSLRLLDSATLSLAKETKSVNKDVTCLKAVTQSNEGDAQYVVTAGRDGRICVLDPRTGARIGEVRTEGNAPVLSLACSSATNQLAAGTELTNHQASVLMWDTRNLGAPIVQYVESHSDDVTELQFHPSRPQILLSGSTDGLVNVYNTTITDEEEALHQTINHGHSVHHANFLNDVDIFAVSHDEHLSIYELVTNPEEGVEEPKPVNLGDMREKLGGEYVANVVKRPDGGAVIGIGSHSREHFELVHLRNKTYGREDKVALRGAHGSEIIRSFCFLDQHQTVLTCGEDGQMKAWRGD